MAQWPPASALPVANHGSFANYMSHDAVENYSKMYLMSSLVEHSTSSGNVVADTIHLCFASQTAESFGRVTRLLFLNKAPAASKLVRIYKLETPRPSAWCKQSWRTIMFYLLFFSSFFFFLRAL